MVMVGKMAGVVQWLEIEIKLLMFSRHLSFQRQIVKNTQGFSRHFPRDSLRFVCGHLGQQRSTTYESLGRVQYQYTLYIRESFNQ